MPACSIQVPGTPVCVNSIIRLISLLSLKHYSKPVLYSMTLDDRDLLYRLAVGLGNKGGARGSLTKCLGRFQAIVHTLQDLQGVRSSDPETYADRLEELKQDFERELLLFQIDLSKYTTHHYYYSEDSPPVPSTAELPDRGESSNDPLSNNIIEKERSEVQNLREQLRKVSSTQTAQQEYEALAKMIHHRHPKSSVELRQELGALETRLEEARLRKENIAGQVKVRQSQFQLVMQSILDLKQSLEDPEETLYGDL